MSVTVFFSIRARPGNERDLLELLLQGRDFALTVDGCEAYAIHQSAGGDGQRFMMVERWASPEAHQRHFEENVVRSGMLAKATALMTEPPIPPVYYELR